MISNIAPYTIAFCSTVDSSHLLNTRSFSCDIETTSLIPQEGQIRLIQIYLPKIKTVVLMPSDFKTSQDDSERAAYDSWLQTLLIQLSNRSVLKIWHNALFDVGWFYYHFDVLSLNNYDTMIASAIHKAGKFYGYKKVYDASPNSLGFLCEESGFIHDKSLQKSDWSEALTEDQMIYGARDAYYTFVKAREYLELLSFCPALVAAEMGAISVFVYMNTNGLQANLETMQEREQQYQSKADELLEILESKIVLDPFASLQWYQDYYTGSGKKLPKKLDSADKLSKECQKTKFVPGSYQSVAKWLYGIVDPMMLKKVNSKTGKLEITTAKGTLFKVYELTKNKDLLNLIQYRSIKLAASKFRKYIESYDHTHQSIYSCYSILAIQGTGRSSSGRKAQKTEGIKYHNVQNFSKHLNSHQSHGLPSTRSIIQSKPGYVLAEFDVAASHIQWARQLSQDASLIESNNSGLKIHYFTLSGILKHSDGLIVTPEETRDLVEGKADRSRQGYYKQLYKLAKNVIYSFLNYAGSATLQGQFFNNEVFVSLDDCRLYLDACADQFSGLRRFQDNKFETVKRTLQATYGAGGKYIGHYAKSHHIDGGITYHAAKRKQDKRIIQVIENEDEDLEVDVTEEYVFVPQTKDMYLKISDVVAACWLRPEATLLKNACRKVFDYQLESGLPFNFVNFSHDSFLLDIREDVLEEVCDFAFNTLNSEYQSLIPDYKPEGTAMDCVLGKMWEHE